MTSKSDWANGFLIRRLAQQQKPQNNSQNGLNNYAEHVLYAKTCNNKSSRYFIVHKSNNFPENLLFLI